VLLDQVAQCAGAGGGGMPAAGGGLDHPPPAGGLLPRGVQGGQGGVQVPGREGLAASPAAWAMARTFPAASSVTAGSGPGPAARPRARPRPGRPAAGTPPRPGKPARTRRPAAGPGPAPPAATPPPRSSPAPPGVERREGFPWFDPSAALAVPMGGAGKTAGSAAAPCRSSRRVAVTCDPVCPSRRGRRRGAGVGRSGRRSCTGCRLVAGCNTSCPLVRTKWPGRSWRDGQ
jgi:hypothetical protein